MKINKLPSLLIIALASLTLTTITTLAQEKTTTAAEARLIEKHITLPPPAPPIGNYLRYVRTGNLLFLAGQGGGKKWNGKGKVGKEVTLQQGYQSARDVGLAMLATTRQALGSLDKVTRVVKVTGYVHSAPTFTEQPKVVNGFSDLMVEVFGKEIGMHARSSIAISTQGRNIPIEVEMILEVKD